MKWTFTMPLHTAVRSAATLMLDAVVLAHLWRGFPG